MKLNKKQIKEYLDNTIFDWPLNVVDYDSDKIAVYFNGEIDNCNHLDQLILDMYSDKNLEIMFS